MSMTIEELAERIAKAHRLALYYDSAKPLNTGISVRCLTCGWARSAPARIGDRADPDEADAALAEWVSQMQRAHGAYQALKARTTEVEQARLDWYGRPIPPDLPDGTGPTTRHRINLDWKAAGAAKITHAINDELAATRRLTFADSLIETVCDVLAANPHSQLRGALTRLAGLTDQWRESINRRNSKANLGPEESGRCTRCGHLKAEHEMGVFCI